MIGLAATVAATLAWVGFHRALPPPVHVNFVTYPFGATILLDGQLLLGDDGRPATTPCTVDGVSARAHDVVLRHPDLPELRIGTVDLRTQRQVVGSWAAVPR